MARTTRLVLSVPSYAVLGASGGPAVGPRHRRSPDASRWTGWSSTSSRFSVSTFRIADGMRGGTVAGCPVSDEALGCDPGEETT
jgi:hypothetical protein